MPCFCFLADFLRNCQSGLKTGQKSNLCPISRDGNIATHKVDVYGFLKTPIEFCYRRVVEGGGRWLVSREHFRAPRLKVYHLKMVSEENFLRLTVTVRFQKISTSKT